MYHHFAEKKIKNATRETTEEVANLVKEGFANQASFEKDNSSRGLTKQLDEIKLNAPSHRYTI